jgi:DNA sulfur modification protein DndB
MKEITTGNIRQVFCKDLGEAQKLAGQEVTSTIGYPIPVVIFTQGERINLTGALPFSFIASRLEVKSAKKKASISETTESMNRPVNQDHADAIAQYILENRNKKYILPPMTLNVQQSTNLYVVDYPSELKTGFLVVPATAFLSITDGQHRRLGIQEALEKLTESERIKLRSDSISVMITCETDIGQIHQDFADCSKTKPLAPSQLAVYDRRNPANRLVLDLEKNCLLFRGKVDATSKTLGMKSTSIFLTNQIRQLVKTLLVRNWQMADLDFTKKVQKILYDETIYNDELMKIVHYVNFLTDKIRVWKEISELKPGVTMNIIPTRRSEGWVCLSVVGLVILGTIGHELFRNQETDWESYAEKLAEIDWRKTGELWKGNIISAGKILNQQKHVREATEQVRKAIGWDPSLGKLFYEMQPADN